ncbi:MAG: flippase-like domain-containing protein [Candidatus Thorarchaeota archaeon]|nr:flippase-like domain-containing protein [Candidatus Thorarchaeota archaeon]
MSETETSDQEQSFISLGKLLAMVIIAVAVYLVMIFIGDWDTVVSYLVAIEWWWILPVMMGLSFMNYFIRYIKWQYYLNRIDVKFSHKDSFSIFLAGFTLTVSPGKIGEMVKGYFCRDVDGTPVAKTVPVVISERVTDLLAMVLLAGFSFLFIFSGGNQILMVAAVGGLAVVGAVVVSNKRFYDMILKRMTSFGPLKRFQDSFDIIEDTMVKTLSPKPMLVGTAISVPGWFMECIELWLLLSILTGAGIPPLSPASLVLLAQATFIHASASAIGAIVIFAPGGVGAYEGYAGIAMVSLGFIPAIATVSTILIRFVTLWFSVIVGFVALGIVTKRKRDRNCETPQQA